jgi:hypothetical protein
MAWSDHRLQTSASSRGCWVMGRHRGVVWAGTPRFRRSPGHAGEQVDFAGIPRLNMLKVLG